RRRSVSRAACSLNTIGSLVEAGAVRPAWLPRLGRPLPPSGAPSGAAPGASRTPPAGGPWAGGPPRGCAGPGGASAGDGRRVSPSGTAPLPADAGGRRVAAAPAHRARRRRALPLRPGHRGGHGPVATRHRRSAAQAAAGGGTVEGLTQLRAGARPLLEGA